MSELKVYHCNEWHNEYTEFYLKDEADKVIADLEESNKKEVGQLLILNREQANAANRLRDSIEQSVQHQKYKRCLAMAERCKYRMYYLAAVVEQEGSKIIPLKAQTQRYEKRERRMDYWNNRWLELAEKFKEKK